MSITLNGWPMINRPGVTRPGPENKSDSGFATDDVADVLTSVMWWWHTEMEPVTQWGGHRKPSFNAGLENSATRSNHLSGTAQDINWTRHPFIRSRKPGSSFTSAQHAQLRDFDARVNGIIRWGWTFTDEMHSEIAPGTSRAQVAAAASRVRQAFVPWRTLDAVAVSQRRVGAGDDGLWGPGSVAKCRKVQSIWGVPQTGLWDVKTDNAYSARVAAIVRNRPLLDDLGVEPTWQGVVDYQRENGLADDGLLGQATRTHMEVTVATINQRLADQDARLERIETRIVHTHELLRQLSINSTPVYRTIRQDTNKLDVLLNRTEEQS